MASCANAHAHAHAAWLSVRPGANNVKPQSPTRQSVSNVAIVGCEVYVHGVGCARVRGISVDCARGGTRAARTACWRHCLGRWAATARASRRAHLLASSSACGRDRSLALKTSSAEILHAAVWRASYTGTAPESAARGASGRGGRREAGAQFAPNKNVAYTLEFQRKQM